MRQQSLVARARQNLNLPTIEVFLAYKNLKVNFELVCIIAYVVVWNSKLYKKLCRFKNFSIFYNNYFSLILIFFPVSLPAKSASCLKAKLPCLDTLSYPVSCFNYDVCHYDSGINVYRISSKVCFQLTWYVKIYTAEAERVGYRQKFIGQVKLKLRCVFPKQFF